jgi:hypothetical protein
MYSMPVNHTFKIVTTVNCIMYILKHTHTHTHTYTHTLKQEHGILTGIKPWGGKKILKHYSFVQIFKMFSF